MRPYTFNFRSSTVMQRTGKFLFQRGLPSTVHLHRFLENFVEGFLRIIENQLWNIFKINLVNHI